MDKRFEPPPKNILKNDTEETMQDVLVNKQHYGYYKK